MHSPDMEVRGQLLESSSLLPVDGTQVTVSLGDKSFYPLSHLASLISSKVSEAWWESQMQLQPKALREHTLNPGSLSLWPAIV